MGAPRLYWWWDVISPVCQPLSSYSYAFHTVGPPRPLIPVSWGGGQTAKQTGGRAAGLFRRCLTRRAWRSILHLQHFQHLLSAWGCKTKGLQKRAEIPAPSMWRKSVSSNVQDVFRVQLCGLGLFTIAPKADSADSPQNHTCHFVMFRFAWVGKGHFILPGHLRWPGIRVHLHRMSSPAVYNKYRKSLCNAFI